MSLDPRVAVLLWCQFFGITQRTYYLDNKKKIIIIRGYMYSNSVQSSGLRNINIIHA